MPFGRPGRRTLNIDLISNGNNLRCFPPLTALSNGLTEILLHARIIRYECGELELDMSSR